jgi:hypothetical protein
VLGACATSPRPRAAPASNEDVGASKCEDLARLRDTSCSLASQLCVDAKPGSAQCADGRARCAALMVRFSDERNPGVSKPRRLLATRSVARIR